MYKTIFSPTITKQQSQSDFYFTFFFHHALLSIETKEAYLDNISSKKQTFVNLRIHIPNVARDLIMPTAIWHETTFT